MLLGPSFQTCLSSSKATSCFLDSLILERPWKSEAASKRFETLRVWSPVFVWTFLLSLWHLAAGAFGLAKPLPGSGFERFGMDGVRTLQCCWPST